MEMQCRDRALAAALIVTAQAAKRLENKKMKLKNEKNELFIFKNYEIISSNLPVSFAILISLAILRPVDKFSSTKSAYGDPEM
ncbi:hypothetical protein MmiAt1_08350 [Methanimicrococcus sp. At1]|uniref:Uncharacterized protein n=1 Tax=Methanimicrococcus hacksteinii TaxID=3028293 RepID=A0ABU3VPC0_9EURY|nr:hypothetical protein [Methanimicrococcus sp. At1]